MGRLAERAATLGRTPLVGEAAGVDARYEPEFERLSGEIAKLGSLAGEVVDWARVVELASAILAARSKDVVVATFLASGLFELEGYAGLAVGLTVLADLHETFATALFPSRPRGRANGLTWLAERLEAAVEHRAPGGGEGAAAATCLEQLRRLDGLAATQYAESAPALGPARRVLEGRVRALEAEAKRKEPLVPAPAAAAPAGAMSASLSSPAAVLKALAAAAPMVKAADPTDPLAYLLPRLAAWGGLTQVPSNEAGKSRVPAPPGATRQALITLLEQGDWPGLLAACDKRLALEPLWLDPQRWAVVALRRLGGGYAAAAAAVVAAVRLLLTRLPNFHLLTFADATPFADGETRLWIDTEVLATTVPPAATGGGAAPPWEEAEQAARATAAGGDLKGGLALLQEGMRAAASDHDRFCWRLVTARLCTTAGRGDLAVPLLEALDEEVERRDLVGWAPELARTVLLALLEARSGAAGKRPTPGDAERLQRLQARLCRLDVVAALDLEGGTVRGR